MAELTVLSERWPIAGGFAISRGTKTEAHVLVVEVVDDGITGRGESVPYARYGETVEAATAALEGVRDSVAAGLTRAGLQAMLPPGAARNALDCALWDLEAKRAGVRAWTLAGLPTPRPVQTCFTLSLAPAEDMARAAHANAARPVLKLKIGGPDDLDRVVAVRGAAPGARLVVDANEALSFDTLRRLAPEFARLGVGLIEQPLKAGEDAALEGWASPVRLCADESLHTRAELADCARRYACVNVKLDKTGGLTEALALRSAAERLGVGVMAGCMVATSLAIAPALLIAQDAEVADLDGPLLLSRDREPGLAVQGSILQPPSPQLWG